MGRQIVMLRISSSSGMIVTLKEVVRLLLRGRWKVVLRFRFLLGLLNA
jgi:hypothetical protein